MRTAFIDLNFHLEQTKSSQFFIDICKTYYNDFHLVGANEAWYEIPRLKPDTIIIWQAVFTPKEIDSWKAKNIILIPMFDAVPMTTEFWNKYKNYKVFCFCKKLYQFLQEIGFSVFYAQYYTKPEFQYREKTDLSIFYWERSLLLNWTLIKKLICSQNIDSIHYHYSTNITDKNDLRPDENDISKYKITFSDWFKSPDDYKKLLESTEIYFAPREQEGIGLSFIEAIAAGCVVAAYDAPTMNEYIANGKNGWLFTENTSYPLDFSPETVQKLKAQSQKDAVEGYNNWQNRIPEIFDFFNTRMDSYNPKISPFVYIYKRLRAEIRNIYYKLIKK